MWLWGTPWARRWVLFTAAWLALLASQPPPPKTDGRFGEQYFTPHSHLTPQETQEDGGDSRWPGTKPEGQVPLSLEKVAAFEEAFGKIKDATGIQDIHELVEKFLQAEDKNFRLFNFVNHTNSEIERLEVIIADTKAEIEKHKGQGVSTDTQRKKILRDLEDRLARTEKKADEYDKKHANAMKTINQLKTGIHSIFTRLGCNR